VLVEAGNVDAEPDAGLLQHLRTAKASGGADWLFVGQVAPHKAQHDVVRAFACYRRAYDARARLRLVGREMGSTYIDAVRRFVSSLGLGEAVALTGSVPVDALAAYYAAADVFVCCSDHEGFCAPVIEAMHRGLPVVANDAAALSETVGDGGVLLDAKDPVLVAAAVHELLVDGAARRDLVSAGERQAARYRLDAARGALRSAIDEVLALT
jgi:glycosyltransferase involved in cell wall biosynthesis